MHSLSPPTSPSGPRTSFRTNLPPLMGAPEKASGCLRLHSAEDQVGDFVHKTVSRLQSGIVVPGSTALRAQRGGARPASGTLPHTPQVAVKMAAVVDDSRDDVWHRHNPSLGRRSLGHGRPSWALGPGPPAGQVAGHPVPAAWKVYSEQQMAEPQGLECSSPRQHWCHLPWGAFWAGGSSHVTSVYPCG